MASQHEIRFGCKIVPISGDYTVTTAPPNAQTPARAVEPNADGFYDATIRIVAGAKGAKFKLQYRPGIEKRY